MKKSVSLFFIGIIHSASIFAQDTVQKIIAGRFNSKEQQEKPYVILISADGFRYDYAEKFHAENLLRLSRQGVAASGMLASFPSLTFPNHYTMVTGLYPAHHGLVNNSFYDETKKAFYALGNRKAIADSSWYGGTPLWVLAEQQQMVTASFYWVGSEAAVKGIRPTYYYNYGEAIKIDDRIAILKNWLQLPADRRPHLITFYLPEVDHEAHTYGPDAKQTGEAVHFVDESIGKLVATIDSLHLAVNYVFVSDHGMTLVDTINGISLPAAIDTNKFIVSRGDVVVHLYAKDKNDVVPVYSKLKDDAKTYDVYLPDETPARWHIKKKDDRYNRVGDIILVPHPPYSFNFGNRKISPGKHGFDPAFKDMYATFFTWGPQIKENRRIRTFENIHIYPFVAKMLGLDYTEKIDGRPSVLNRILK